MTGGCCSLQRAGVHGDANGGQQQSFRHWCVNIGDLQYGEYCTIASSVFIGEALFRERDMHRGQELGVSLSGGTVT
jgi:hypothetical protein